MLRKEKVNAAIRRLARTCVWTRDADEQYGHDSWDGTCGVKWCISVGTPAENGMNYCPRCGARLEQAKENPDAT